MAENKRSLYLILFPQCKKNNIALWQCPTFLFLIMGLVNVGAMFAAYLIGRNILTEDTLVIAVVAVAVILLIISNTVSRSFERLIELNRMKTEFARIISHQLRTPLSAIKWSISSLMTTGCNDEKERLDYLMMIRENNERMIRLINDLLIAARLEGGSLQPKLEKIPLAKLVLQIGEEFKKYALANNVELTIQSGKEDLNVTADPEYLKIVLRNLLDNAIRYTNAKGSVAVRVFVDGKQAVCSIKDGGVGIPELDKKQIFQRFFRAHNILRHQTEGTGLGLYIVKEIIDMLGGKISFISLEDKGSTFYFTLPIAK